MYSFWITVIGYSVIMLILVYTYQFHNFPKYWKYYLHIDEDLQKDIGLEKYETKDLFVRLLTPTFFVIITVLQIHYFHKDFLEVTDIEKFGLVCDVSGIIVHLEKNERLKNYRPEEIPRVERSSLGHSPILTMPTSSPGEVFLVEEDKTSVYSLRQLKRMANPTFSYKRQNTNECADRVNFQMKKRNIFQKCRSWNDWRCFTSW